MEFFYDQIIKIRNNIVLVSVFVILITISDLSLFVYFHNSIKDVKRENSDNITLNNPDENLNNFLSQDNTFKVDIKGEVKKPGVYEVDEKMNVQDAINKAGGLTKKATTDSINLSKLLKSEMVIIVPSKSSNKDSKTDYNNLSLSDNKSSSINNDASITNDLLLRDTVYGKTDSLNSGENNNKLVSINNANLEELMQITGIGESKAKAIIEYRDIKPFKSIDEIKNVSGIGDALFEKIKDFICI